MKSLKIVDIAVFAMLAALMFVSKYVLEFLPNVHLIGVFIIATTVIYRKFALFPLYAFVFLIGLFNGWPLWWIPYLYIWTALWGMTMLLPKRMSPKCCIFAYAAVCGAHGFLYGTLYAPSQALLFGLNFKGMLTWIAAGLPWDVLHGCSNLVVGGLLIMPLVRVMQHARKFSQ